MNELKMLVMPDNTMTIEYGLVLEPFGSYFEKAIANELGEICRTVLEAVYTDFVNSRVTRFKPAAEFIELFRIAARRVCLGAERAGEGSAVQLR